MDRLSPLDATFLIAEDEDPNTSMAIASVAVLAGPPPTQHEFTDFIRGRLPMIPRWRQRVRTIPLDLGRPSGYPRPTSTWASTCDGPLCPHPATTRRCSR